MNQPELNKDIAKPEHCQNCNHIIDKEAAFCPNCGQKALPEHLTIKYFIDELLNNYFSFDSKFFNTIIPLLTKPSFLSSEFIAGRRVRYINPIQLFVFVSFLYFLTDSFMFLKEAKEKKDFVVMKENGEPISSDSLNLEQLYHDDITLSEDSTAENDAVSSGVNNFIKKSQEFNRLEKDEQNERVSKMISYFIFLLMPLFALFLNILFGKRSRRYIENLIFSLHFHAFFFLIATIFMLADRLIPDPFDGYILISAILIYLLVALKKFYNYSLISTLFRSVGLFFMYGFVVMITYLLSIVISVFL